MQISTKKVRKLRLVLPEARPYVKDLPILADSGYEGAGADVQVPVKKPVGGELDTGTKPAMRYCATSATRANTASP